MRKRGVRNASLYKWKAKYGGMDVREAKKLKALEDDNARLKKLLADAMLDNSALKDLLEKMVTPLPSEMPVHGQAKLSAIARQLNERPRKTLLYRTPAEKFAECVAAIS